MLSWRVKYVLAIGLVTVLLAILLAVALGIKGEYAILIASLLPVDIVEARRPGAWRRFVGGKPKVN